MASIDLKTFNTSKAIGRDLVNVCASESFKRKLAAPDPSGANNKRGPGAVQDPIQGSSYPSRTKLVFSLDGSNVKWFLTEYNLPALKDSWDAMSSGLAFNNIFTTGLLCQVGPGKTLVQYVHRAVSKLQLAAIREWRSSHSILDVRNLVIVAGPITGSSVTDVRSDISKPSNWSSMTKTQHRKWHQRHLSSLNGLMMEKPANWLQRSKSAKRRWHAANPSV